jgi:hypothetical protein
MLFALGQDGSTKWTAKTGPVVKAAPALGEDGTVYVASMDDHLYAIAPPTGGGNPGSVKWTFTFGDHPGSGPPVTDPTAPFPGDNGVGSGDTPTIGPDGTIYVGVNNSNFYAIAPDGQLRWMFEAQREVAGIWSAGAITADGSTVYFGANKGGVYAVNTQDGRSGGSTTSWGPSTAHPHSTARVACTPGPPQPSVRDRRRHGHTRVRLHRVRADLDRARSPSRRDARDRYPQRVGRADREPLTSDQQRAHRLDLAHRCMPSRRSALPALIRSRSSSVRLSTMFSTSTGSSWPMSNG